MGSLHDHHTNTIMASALEMLMYSNRLLFHVLFFSSLPSQPPAKQISINIIIDAVLLSYPSFFLLLHCYWIMNAVLEMLNLISLCAIVVLFILFSYFVIKLRLGCIFFTISSRAFCLEKYYIISLPLVVRCTMTRHKGGLKSLFLFIIIIVIIFYYYPMAVN